MDHPHYDKIMKKEPGFDWTKFQEALSSRTETPPECSVSSYDISKKTGMNINSLHSMLRGMVSSGKMKSGLFWRKESNRRVRYYWFSDGQDMPEDLNPGKKKT